MKPKKSLEPRKRVKETDWWWDLGWEVEEEGEKKWERGRDVPVLRPAVNLSITLHFNGW